MMLIYLCLASHKRYTGKQCGPNQMPQNAASDQGVHCLLFVQELGQ